ncbi:MAG: SAV_6107 family HEPN domain-containing protein [Nocardioides sp.]|uniref:SAV_6107 family HEPN domain-containing protein n=1 Tax=Nocardioides sp. TaxID=35761 RepID=UPI0039E41592
MSTSAFLPATTHVYLERSAMSLAEAVGSADPPSRYVNAHVAALRAAAAWLAARAAPGPVNRRKRNAWVLLSSTSPEMAGWAAFFSAGAAKRAAAEAGSAKAVTAAEAEDLIAAADRFLAAVEEGLGLTVHVPVAAPVRDAV